MANNTPAKVLSPDEMADLSQQVALLAEMYNRRLSDAAMEMWVESLAPRYGTALRKAMRKACQQQFMPSLGEVLEYVRRERENERIEEERAEAQRERERKAAEEAALTPEERAEKERRSQEFWDTMKRKLGGFR